MPSLRRPLPLSIEPLVPLPFIIAASLVALGWLMMIDMLRGSLLLLKATSFGPGMSAVGGVFMMLEGLPFEFISSLCRTDAAPSLSWEDWTLFCGMTVLMTLTMMVPCATPAWAILRSGRSAAQGFRFIGGYALPWTLFSVALATMDRVLDLQMGPHLVSTAGLPGIMAACLVIAAGAFQWMPAKHRQRRRIGSVRLPTAHRDPSGSASFAAGVRYACCCVRSNGLLMATMMVLGMMNIVAMALLLAAMLLEKRVEKNHVSYMIGLALVLAGIRWMSLAAMS
ncbi:putative metal-binding membrane protein [Rhizobium sp. PP-F2F-G36]|nr:putative metal-binding membrane protein [Rhizobium sp. PP-F2F-G36]